MVVGAAGAAEPDGAAGRARRRRLVGLLALFASLRIALLAATLPIFVHLDEDAHFDTVHKYARGQWPEPGSDRYDPEVADIGTRFQSGDWLVAPDPDPRKRVLPGVFVDPRLRARDPAAAAMAADPTTVAAIETMLARNIEAARDRSPNYEAFEPPAYGLFAGTWLRFGRMLGVDGAAQVLWVRLLGALFAAGAVLLTYRLACVAVPGVPSVALGAALLVAVAGQDVAACVSNDAPDLLLGPATLLCAFALSSRPCRGSLAFVGGVVLALPLLAKLTTLHASAAAWLLLLIRCGREWRRLVPIACGFLVPIVAWVLYARIVLGMWHGGEHKVALTHLGPQTLDGLLHHPMFTPAGAWTFFSEIATQLWRGDLWFHGHPLRHVWMDLGYLVLPTVGLFALLRNREPRLRSTRGAGLALGASVAFAVLVMAGISLAWNFDHASFPTREHPYFTQGRLVAACLPALAILTTLGFARLLGPRGGLVLTAVFALVMLGSGIALHWPIYTSSHSVWRLI